VKSYHESIEDEPQAVPSLDEAKKTKDPETSQDCDDTSDLQRSVGRNKNTEDWAKNNNCVEYIPTIWEVNSWFNSYQLNNRLDTKYCSENIVHVFTRQVKFVSLLVPFHKQNNRISNNAEEYYSLVYQWICNPEKERAATWLRLFKFSKRLRSQHKESKFNPLFLFFCEQIVASNFVMLAMKSANHHSDEEIKEEKWADNHEKDEEKHPNWVSLWSGHCTIV
jgi:hypothetical protein